VVRLFEIASANQSAERTLKRALEMNPNNRVFLQALVNLRPDGPEHIAYIEALLATYPADSEAAASWREHIERDKKRGDRRRRVLASPYQAARIPIEIMRDSPSHFRGWGLKLSINGIKPIVLMLDTGASGIALNDKVAATLGLERETMHNFEVGGIGSGKRLKAHRETARKVDIGGVVFTNYPIEIVEGKVEEDAGLIGTDVFAQFLVTIDLPGEQIGLTPFPGIANGSRPRRSLTADALGRDGGLLSVLPDRTCGSGAHQNKRERSILIGGGFRRPGYHSDARGGRAGGQSQSRYSRHVQRGPGQDQDDVCDRRRSARVCRHPPAQRPGSHRF